MKIRGIITNRARDEKKKMLRRSLQRQGIERLNDPDYIFYTEQNEINKTIESIAQLVIDFESSKYDSVPKRARLARLFGKQYV